MRISKLFVLLNAVMAVALTTVGIAAAAPSGQDANSDGDATAQHRPERQPKAFLGLATKPLTDHEREVLDLPADLEGAVVMGAVPDGPAAVAGMQRGDVVLKAQGEAVTGPRDINAIVHAMQPGDVITLQYVRDGARATVDIELSEPPQRDDRGDRQAPPWLKHLRHYLAAFPNTIEASITVMDAEGNVHVWEITQGIVAETTENGLTVKMKTEETASFELADGSVVIMGGHRVEITELEEEAHVVVLEIDGQVKAVVAGPIKRDREVRPSDQRRNNVERFQGEMRELREGFKDSDARGRDRAAKARQRGGQVQERVQRFQDRLHQLQQRAQEDANESHDNEEPHDQESDDDQQGATGDAVAA